MLDEPIYIKIGSWFAALLPAILGSAISLKLVEQNASFMSRLFSFMFGVAIAHFVGGAIVDSFNIDTTSMIDDAIILASGIFGMTTATELGKQIPFMTRGISERVIKFFQK